MSVIVTGDDVALPVTLKKDGVTFNIDAGATVQAALVSLDRSTTLIAAVTCSNVASGADWTNSLVVVEFDTTATGAVASYTDAYVEIQVDDGGKLTWFTGVLVQKGSIS